MGGGSSGYCRVFRVHPDKAGVFVFLCKHKRTAWFVKSGQCQWLKGQEEPKKRKHKAMKNVFEGCGAEPSEQERFKLAFAVGESSESESDSESDSEREGE